MKYLPALSVSVIALSLSSCATTSGPGEAPSGTSRTVMLDAIAKEPKGAYYVGRRYYKVDYKFWGYIRESGKPWSTAKMVMMNENSKLAPDREQGALGTDNNYEYKLFGSFTGDSVYEPASNHEYPEFKLKGYELLSTSPAPIYHEVGATNPERRIIATTY